MRSAVVRRAPATWLVVAVLVVVGSLLPLLVAAHFDALVVPRGDGWSYALSAFHFADTGHLRSDWALMNLVGQVVLAAPVILIFGHSVTALQVSVAVLGVIGLLAVFDLAASVLPRRHALFVALVVALGPMWAPLSVSFMTDVPAFAFGAVCLALGARALGRNELRVGLFVAALVVGFVGFTIRESVLAAVVAVCVVGLWSGRSYTATSQRVVKASIAALVLAIVAFAIWRRALPDFRSLPTPTLTSFYFKLDLHILLQCIILVGFLIAPAVILAGPVRLVRSAWSASRRATLVLGGGVLLLLLWELTRHRATGSYLSPGEYVDQRGALGGDVLHGARPLLMPNEVFLALGVIGALAAAVTAAAFIPSCVRGFRTIRASGTLTPKNPAAAIVAVGALSFGAAVTLELFLNLPFYDRYLLPLVPLLSVLVLGAARASVAPAPQRALWGVAALVVLGAISFVYAANSASYDGTSWAFAQRMGQVAGSAKLVDGGYNHYARDSTVYGSLFDAPAYCIVVRQTADPTGRDHVATRTVWSPFGDQLFLVADRLRSC